jgi:Tfp pilus assembly protein PilO
MDSQTTKQLVVGGLLGILASGAIYFALSSKREELEELRASNEKLQAEVDKGRKAKANYDSLKAEVEEQEARIAELVKLFAMDNERSRINQLVQRLAREAKLGQMQSQAPVAKPVKAEYYTEYETNYKYPGGFLEYGQFLSFVSGFDKIINVSEITMTRNSARNSVYPANIGFKLSVFVYDDSAPAKPAAPRPAASTAHEED